MPTFEENELLCRVGPGTAMGTMLRRYWFPVLLASELRPGGRPQRVGLLGERLIAFRAADGTLALLAEACPHRGVSLALGNLHGATVRCPYHGWCIDASGRILEMPAEPAGSTFKDKLRAQAYGLREHGSLLWAYLGPPELEPPMMNFEWSTLPAEYRWIGKIRQECNWLQCVDGILDSVHISYLHTEAFALGSASVLDRRGVFALPSDDGQPRFELQNMPYGFRYAAIRRPAVDPETTQHVRVTQFVAPVYTLVPPPQGLLMMQIFVPIDDEHTMFFYVKANVDRPMSDDERRMHEARSSMRPGIDMDDQFRKFRRPENDWLQGDGDEPFGVRVPGVAMQDMVVQESMGALYDRSCEHLGASDVAVIRLRRLLLEAVRSFANGSAPLGLGEPIRYGAIRAEDRVLPRAAAWQDVGAYAEALR